MLNYIIFGLLGYLLGSNCDKSCILRKYNHSSYVCVCNSTYCDEIDPVVTLPKSRYVAYVSTIDGLRFDRRLGKVHSKGSKNFKTIRNFWSYTDDEDVTIKVLRSKKYQKMIGFGAAFTDTAGINLLSLSANTQNNLINSYFSRKGIRLNFCRVPIGGTDFSTHPYAYNMEPVDDVNLSNFSLTKEDYRYKIPFIKRAMAAAPEEILLVASSWSPPNWMKTNNNTNGISTLFMKYYQTYADYHLKFLIEYDKSNVTFWGITTGNEPYMGLINLKISLNSLGWNAEQMAGWIANNFGPTLRKSKYKNIKIFCLDDTSVANYLLQTVLSHDDVLHYVDGISTHWYYSQYLPVFRTLHKLYPSMILINGESALNYETIIREKIKLGSWSTAEIYMKRMIEQLEIHYSGWIDWNLILSENGGPRWRKDGSEAAIIALPERDEFLKQPFFYFTGHVSIFVPRGSVRIGTKSHHGFMRHIAFQRPDGSVAFILLNRSEQQKKVTIKDRDSGHISIEIPKRSIVTLVYS